MPKTVNRCTWTASFQDISIFKNGLITPIRVTRIFMVGLINVDINFTDKCSVDIIREITW